MKLRLRCLLMGCAARTDGPGLPEVGTIDLSPAVTAWWHAVNPFFRCDVCNRWSRSRQHRPCCSAKCYDGWLPF